MTLPAANLRRSRALRRADAVALYRVSLSTVDRAVRSGLIRSRKVGAATLLNPDDCEREWGWPEEAEIEPTDRDVAEVLEFVSS